MTDAISLYCNHLRVLARGKRTIHLYRHYLTQHATWLANKIRTKPKPKPKHGKRPHPRAGKTKKANNQDTPHPSQVRLSHLEAYTRYLLSKHAASTARARTVLLTRFYAFLEKQKVISKSPALGLVLPKTQDTLLRTPPNAEKVEKVLAAIDTTWPVGVRHKAILEVLWSTGLRISELLELELGDIQLRDRTVLVRNGKGGKDRVCLLSARAQQALRDYIHKARPKLAVGLEGYDWWAEHSRKTGRTPDKALWLTSHGGVLDQPNLRLTFRKWEKRFGAPLHPHSIRHAFAVHLLRKGADIRHVQVLLGHERIDTTRVYLTLVLDDYKKAYDKAFPFIIIRLPKKAESPKTGRRPGKAAGCKRANGKGKEEAIGKQTASKKGKTKKGKTKQKVGGKKAKAGKKAVRKKPVTGRKKPTTKPTNKTLKPKTKKPKAKRTAKKKSACAVSRKGKKR